MKIRLHFLLAFGMLTLATWSLFAQNHRLVTIVGSVSDPTGARIPAATLSFDNPISKDRKSFGSDENGQFRIDLPAGTYHLQGVAPGFCPEVRRDLRIGERAQLFVNLRLVACAIESGVVIDSATGKADGFSKLVAPVKEEALRRSGTGPEIVVQFGRKDGSASRTNYFGITGTADTRIQVQLSYGYYRILADTISVVGSLYTAEGKVAFEDGESTQAFRRLRFSITGGRVKIHDFDKQLAEPNLRS